MSIYFIQSSPLRLTNNYVKFPINMLFNVDLQGYQTIIFFKISIFTDQTAPIVYFPHIFIDLSAPTYSNDEEHIESTDKRCDLQHKNTPN